MGNFAEQIWGKTRYLARAIGLLTDLTCPSAGRTVEPGSGARIWGQARYHGDRHDVGYTRYGDRHDARYTDQERLTSNVQLSTFNGVTERAHVGRDMGTDTMFGGWRRK